MIRYRLSNGVALHTTISRDRADRSARGYLDPATVIEEDVEIVGVTGPGDTDDYVLWADGRRSPPWDLPAAEREAARMLPAAARDLLLAVWGSDDGACAEVGGPLVVARVVTVQSEVALADPRRTRGGYQSPRVDRLDVTLDDGSCATWYAASVGYCEGYLYQIRAGLDSARSALDGYDARLVPAAAQTEVRS